jgi:hypothetical protein
MARLQKGNYESYSMAAEGVFPAKGAVAIPVFDFFWNRWIRYRQHLQTALLPRSGLHKQAVFI